MLKFDRHSALFIAQSSAFGLLLALIIHFFLLNPDQTERSRQVTLTAASAHQNAIADTVFSYRDAVERAAPSVVNIFTRSKFQIDRSNVPPLFDKLFDRDTGPDSNRHVETSVGSGVIVSPEGYIITNHHVIAAANEIRVILTNGGSFPAVLVGTDTETDLAVLRIDASRPLPAITFADTGQVQVGDVVLAIGNPFGVGQTVTQGIVSATSRNRLGLDSFEEFIQTDAAINPGNSGGALINPRGELIGINTAIFTNSAGAQGISFAIPISLAQNVMIQLIENGEVARGWLGVQAYDITAEMRTRFRLEDPGVLVTGIFYDSPAELAGIQAGDILTHIEGEPLRDTQTLLNATKNRPPTTRVTIEGLRNGKPYAVTATLMKRPSNP